MISNDRNNDLEIKEGVVSNPEINVGKKVSEHYIVEAFRDGKLLWVEEFDNLVVNVGLDDSLDKHLKGSAYTAAWYVGLTDGTPSFAAGDTMASHVGWTEEQTYDELVRQDLTLGAVSGQSVDNSASKAVFTISGTATFGGAFVCSDDTKGGTTGILYGGGAFSQDRNLIDNDVLNVTVICTASAS